MEKLFVKIVSPSIYPLKLIVILVYSFDKIKLDGYPQVVEVPRSIELDQEIL